MVQIVIKEGGSDRVLAGIDTLRDMDDPRPKQLTENALAGSPSWLMR